MNVNHTISDIFENYAKKKLAFPNKLGYTAEEFCDFDKNWKEKLPISFKMHKVINKIEFFCWYHIWDRCERTYYYIRNRFFKRYHLIRTDLAKGQWWDVDNKMLYGMMNLLVDFVEKEHALLVVDWEGSSESHAAAKKEIIEIYTWWKDYPRRQKEMDAIFDKIEDKFDKEECIMASFTTERMDKNRPIYEERSAAEDKLEKEEEEMLIRLIKIRKYLWT